MQRIDLTTWPRRQHFALFRALDHPYFGVTVDVPLGAWREALRQAGRPFYAATVHQVALAANAVEAFRLRIRGEEVVLHERVHPSFTVPWGEGLFNFCTVDFEADAEAFLARCLPAMRRSERAEGLLLDEAHRDDLIFLSALPWLAFTGLSQVGDARSGDSYPRIAWGKLRPSPEGELLPVNVQLHHALADGRHAADFIARLEAGIAADTAALLAQD